MCSRTIVCWYAAVLFLFSSCNDSWAADFYVWQHLILDVGKPSPTWCKISERDRLQFLAQDRTFVEMRGPIQVGDHAELTSIHELVPIVALHISSNGGSVTEALKIAAFAKKYAIQVATDMRCDAETKVAETGDQNAPCGCASACALIWLSAPDRTGAEVRVHRPYFSKEEFPALPDDIALAEYEKAIADVRSLLHSDGFSQEFISALFRTPRESSIKLTIEEIANLPIDISLDELLRSRCYRGNEKHLAEYSAISDALRDNDAKIQVLIDKLPNEPGATLEQDPFYSKDYAQWIDLRHQRDKLYGDMKSLQKIQDKFRKCMRGERENVAMRRGGQRLNAEQRKILGELGELVGMQASDAPVESFMKKYMPEHDFTHSKSDDMRVRDQQIRDLWQSIEPTLPDRHKKFLLTAEAECERPRADEPATANPFDQFDEPEPVTKKP